MTPTGQFNLKSTGPTQHCLQRGLPPLASCICVRRCLCLSTPLLDKTNLSIHPSIHRIGSDRIGSDRIGSDRRESSPMSVHWIGRTCITMHVNLHWSSSLCVAHLDLHHVICGVGSLIGGRHFFHCWGASHASGSLQL